MGSAIKLEIDKNSEMPIYIQLYEQLKYHIENEILKKDTKLPTIRELSRNLQINSVTVVNAYKLLEEKGLIYKRMGSGTYVMPLKENIITDIDIPLIMEEADYSSVAIDSDIIDFASASPDPDLFPVSDFKKVINEILERDKGAAFTYQDSHGYKPLRDSICKYMTKYDISVSADDVYIISGAQQGIDIISKVLLSNGDYVFVESPTYVGAVAAFKSRGAKIVDIPLLSDGMDMNELEKMLKLIKPKFIYVMPNFQNPTGCSYTERKKNHLLLLCKKYDVLIVEDDYLSDLSYTGVTAKPLKSYDTLDKVIYIKSFSKIFMPGLRVAYLIIPEFIKDKVVNAKYVTDISTSGFMQRVLDLYFTNGIWDKHIEYMKKEYSIRYLEAVRCVRKCLRGVHFNQPNGGLNLWLKLPDNITSTEYLASCIKNNIRFIPGTAFFSTSEGEKYLRLSFAAISSEKIVHGISVMGEILEELLSEKKRR